MYRVAPPPRPQLRVRYRAFVPRFAALQLAAAIIAATLAAITPAAFARALVLDCDRASGRCAVTEPLRGGFMRRSSVELPTRVMSCNFGAWREDGTRHYQVVLPTDQQSEIFHVDSRPEDMARFESDYDRFLRAPSQAQLHLTLPASEHETMVGILACLGLLAIALGALSAVRRSTRPIEVEVDRVRGVIRVRRRFGTEPLEVPIDAVKELAVEQSSTPAGIPWDPTRRIATGRLLLCLRNGKEVPIDADFRAPLRAHEDAMHRLHAELTATPLDP